MPICNPIKRSAALLQSRYDSLLPRGTDRESRPTQVCLCLGECVCAWRNTQKHIRRDRTSAFMCAFCPSVWSASAGPEPGLIRLHPNKRLGSRLNLNEFHYFQSSLCRSVLLQLKNKVMKYCIAHKKWNALGGGRIICRTWHSKQNLVA